MVHNEPQLKLHTEKSSTSVLQEYINDKTYAVPSQEITKNSSVKKREKHSPKSRKLRNVDETKQSQVIAFDQEQISYNSSTLPQSTNTELETVTFSNSLSATLDNSEICSLSSSDEDANFYPQNKEALFYYETEGKRCVTLDAPGTAGLVNQNMVYPIYNRSCFDDIQVLEQDEESRHDSNEDDITIVSEPSSDEDIWIFPEDLEPQKIKPKEKEERKYFGLKSHMWMSIVMTVCCVLWAIGIAFKMFHDAEAKFRNKRYAPNQV